MPLEQEVPSVSSAITTSEGQSPTGTVPTEHGGIDLSQIELTLKDDKYVSSLNLADLKILRAAKALPAHNIRNEAGSRLVLLNRWSGKG